MNRTNVIIAIALLGLSGYVLIESMGLSFGGLRTPRAGFFPAILSAVLAVLSLVLLVQATKEKEATASPFRLGAESWRRIGFAVGVLLAFGFSVDFLGYTFSSFLLIAILLRAFEPMKWSLIIIIALSTSVISFGIFGWLLQTPLPTGIFGI